MKNIRTNKGITLIALVITIIVLLILAGITIATLTGENGILIKANTAKDLTIKEEEKEQIKLAYSTVIADKLHNEKETVVTADELQVKLENQNAGATVETVGDKIKVTFTKSGNVYMVDGETGEILGSTNNEGQTPTEPEEELPTVEESKNEKTVFEKETLIKDSANKVVKIPAGFKIAEDSADTIAEGVVIEDTTANHNQFVWVPVDNMANFKTIEGYSNNNLQSMLTNCTELFANGYSTEQAEYNAMYDSVKNNHGFYIGRFEAGKDSSGNVVVKKGANVYNNVPWGNSMNDIEGTSQTGGKVGAVKLAKEFAKKNKYQGITSTLCYGVQWDATLKFIDSAFTGFVKDNRKQGWHSDNYNKTDSGNTETNTNHITGKDLIYRDKLTEKANKQKNIYDMAGNVREWTMETYIPNNRVTRGGGYINDGLHNPSSSRYSNLPDYTGGNIGFRVVLHWERIEQ